MNYPCTPAQHPEKPAHRYRNVKQSRTDQTHRRATFVFLCFTVFLSTMVAGCLATTSTPLPATHTLIPPTSTLTPTATIIWFPPTATFTPYPTSIPLTPTEDMRPDLGDIILKDDFANDSLWSTTQTALGSALIGANQLTITIPEEKLYLTSIRQEPLLGDYYIEVTASPTFCQGQDEYGLLLRYASPGDYYRFGVSCDGQVRLDRLYRDQASSAQPWLLSGALPIGAPSRSRLGVWLNGRELRVFVNDEFQFQVSDPQLTQGQIGFFARATGGHILTVNFSNLVIRQINP